MTTQTFSSLTILGALILGGTAHAQSTRSLNILNSGNVGLSCDIESLPTGSVEVRAELSAVQSEADRAMCLSDGVAFVTDLGGEVRVSVLAPMADGALGITDHYLTTEDTTQFDQLAAVSVGAGGPLPYPNISASLSEACGIVDQFSDVCDAGTALSEICDAGTALQSADGRRLGWHEICDVGASWSEICDVGASWSEICDAGTALESGYGEISGVFDQFVDVCDAGTALQSADGRRLGWAEICDVGASLTLGGQEGEPVRAILDAMVSYTNAPDSMYIDDASSNYTESRGEGLVYRALCTNELVSGPQRPEDGLISLVIITALIDASN